MSNEGIRLLSISQSCSDREELKGRNERSSLCCTHKESTPDLGGVVAPVGGLVWESDVDTYRATIEGRLQPPGFNGVSKGLS